MYNHRTAFFVIWKFYFSYFLCFYFDISTYGIYCGEPFFLHTHCKGKSFESTILNGEGWPCRRIESSTSSLFRIDDCFHHYFWYLGERYVEELGLKKSNNLFPSPPNLSTTGQDSIDFTCYSSTAKYNCKNGSSYLLCARKKKISSTNCSLPSPFAYALQ